MGQPEADAARGAASIPVKPSSQPKPNPSIRHLGRQAEINDRDVETTLPERDAGGGQTAVGLHIGPLFIDLGTAAVT